MMGLFWGVGCIVGPAIGGGFSSSSATWRWAFYLSLPLTACFIPIYLFLFPSLNPQPNITAYAKLRQLDWLGFILNATALFSLTVALAFGGSTWRWDSAGPITLLVVLGGSLFLYALQQRYCVYTTLDRRLFPVQFLKDRTYLLLYIATACSAATSFLTIYYVPLLFQFTKKDTAIQAAVRLLPFIFALVVFVMLSGSTLPKVGRYMPYYIVSGVFIIIGGALMRTINSQTSTSKIYGYEVLLGIGAGLTLQTAYTLIAFKVPPNEVSAGICFINVGQIGSITIALSVAGCIFQNIGFKELREALDQFHFTDSDLRSALAGFDSMILAGTGDAESLAIDAIVKTISKIWTMQLAAGILCIVSGILMSIEKIPFSRGIST